MRKLNGYVAEILKEMIREDESFFEIDGKRYFLSLIDEPETSVREDVEHDPELKQKLLQAKKDILEGRNFSTDEVIEMIEQGEL
ncbi:hypothetical protein KO561_17225 [Radiobacillus kanasensis]|uniref:hypothetical protein n=1 Tax=Radiobacillus kanasensis TaxID=2844358 RepID=UPI001E4C7F35|nr:hypothetical protein [Radiobacillus kanasensis]UFT98914.1 hypothetical protein KO561_17225 [Radiobacillus kanasensis]